MQNEKTEAVSGWLKRYQGVERTEDRLTPTAQTADVFCAASATASIDAAFEREPSQFFALLHALAPDELKK
ncbi:MAG: hypothetical protein HQ483_11870 [Rhodospirillales bacterium]|nr:hypothetical protein [Rhodospirillales bacterium]